jgi:inorganic pyrophosphatase
VRPNHALRSGRARPRHDSGNLHPFYTGIRSYRDLPTIMCEQVAHFFQHYKDLEKGKWVTIVRWLDAQATERLVMEAIARGAGA